MSAETLRRAAALMRERAEVWEYHAGPWHTRPGYAGHTVIRCKTNTPADEFGPGGEMDTFIVDCDTTSTAKHIASWHPDVALAVADWLDATAERLDLFGYEVGDTMPPTHKASLAVARAYLGESHV